MTTSERDPLLRIAEVVAHDSRFERAVNTERYGAVLAIENGVAMVVAVVVDGPETVVALEPYLERIVAKRIGVLFVGDVDERLIARLPPGIVAQALHAHAGENACVFAVRGMLEHLELLTDDRRLTGALERARYELRELSEIGRAITQERDLTKLLNLILTKSRFITGADAGSIYVVETAEDGTSRRLRFKMSQNDSCQFESTEFTIPISTRSIAGYAAETLEPINIANVNDIPKGAPYGYDASFDKRVGYTTRSMIAVPMVSAEDEVIGVIQLINKKRNGRAVLRADGDFDREVVPFDARSAELLTSLASQAGIVLENAMLYDEISRIFEGFVRASVQAIEQRDPTTSGHSLRVSVLSCRLAEKVDRADSGAYAKSKFSVRELKELEYASLLHDFGKIGVREQVLVKAKKLYPHVLDAIRERVHFIAKDAELEAMQRKLALIEGGAPAHELRAVDEWLHERRAALRDSWKTIEDANEPTVLSEGEFSRISEVARTSFVDGAGETRLLLNPEEMRSLSVRKGSLNDEEMNEIRSHVIHTFEFLTRIPWGKSFSRVAEIAGAHHEKLNGTGYPHGKHAAEIPLQSKIMTIADIYDALTARDRPYKKAMPAERALGILDFEVKDGNVDAELMRIFREAEVFKSADEPLTY